VDREAVVAWDVEEVEGRVVNARVVRMVEVRTVLEVLGRAVEARRVVDD
jgi:hypothetical protein